MVLWPSSRISVARFYSLTFMWLSSNEGRRYRVPPNFPVRFRPSDVIEFGSDKKVAILLSFAFYFSSHLVCSSYLANCSSDGAHPWIDVKPFLVNYDQLVQNFTGYVPGEGAEHAPIRIRKKWEAAGAAAATASPSGSMNGDTSQSVTTPIISHTVLYSIR